MFQKKHTVSIFRTDVAVLGIAWFIENTGMAD
jgi:hypothetical protein